jgi:hypothetical protein
MALDQALQFLFGNWLRCRELGDLLVHLLAAFSLRARSQATEPFDCPMGFVSLSFRTFAPRAPRATAAGFFLNCHF